jgi:hypothetical protein
VQAINKEKKSGGEDEEKKRKVGGRKEKLRKRLREGRRAKYVGHDDWVSEEIVCDYW